MMRSTPEKRRLDKAFQAARGIARARAEADAAERQALIAQWDVPSIISGNPFPDNPFPDSFKGLPEAEIDRRLLVLAQEAVYQWEMAHGPVLPWPAPGLSPGDVCALPTEQLVAFAKDMLQGTEKQSADILRGQEGVTSMKNDGRYDTK